MNCSVFTGRRDPLPSSLTLSRIHVASWRIKSANLAARTTSSLACWTVTASVPYLSEYGLCPPILRQSRPLRSASLPEATRHLLNPAVCSRRWRSWPVVPLNKASKSSFGKYRLKSPTCVAPFCLTRMRCFRAHSSATCERYTAGTGCDCLPLMSALAASFFVWAERRRCSRFAYTIGRSPELVAVYTKPHRQL